MKKLPLFLALAIIAGLVGFWQPWWWLGIPLWWLSLNMLLLGVAYAGLGPGLIGKRPDGGLSWWAWVVYLPMQLMNRLGFIGIRNVGPEAAYHEVAPGLLLGRRLTESEAKRLVADGPVACLDITCEWDEPPSLRGEHYHSFPVLDGTALDDRALQQALDIIAGHHGQRPVLVHCAQGHGRSAIIAGAWLIHQGLADSVDGAVALMRTQRPGVNLRLSQRQVIERWLAARAGDAPAPGPDGAGS